MPAGANYAITQGDCVSLRSRKSMVLWTPLKLGSIFLPVCKDLLLWMTARVHDGCWWCLSCSLWGNVVIGPVPWPPNEASQSNFAHSTYQCNILRFSSPKSRLPRHPTRLASYNRPAQGECPRWAKVHRVERFATEVTLGPQPTLPPPKSPSPSKKGEERGSSLAYIEQEPRSWSVKQDQESHLLVCRFCS